MNSLPTAVFLDRDGTIIDDAHYLADPERAKLIEGAGEAISRINAALVPVIVITNQSGIGRGMFTSEDHKRVSRRVQELLASHGAHVDAWYHCPHAPDDGCQCRKPGLLLFRRAAADRPEIDLARSLYIGDRMRDVEPGLALGGDAVLVPSPETPSDETIAGVERARVAPSLGTALDWFLCSN